MNLHYTTQFKRDYKKIKKQNKDVAKLRAVIEDLLAGQSLKPKHRDHQLFGNWEGHRDCHIEPDWVLIYRITNGNLYLERTGSHSELFKK
ncbi:MAG: type II toxin-antitoxin system mRNA interferase toxin, RelE/StbE family, partial [Deltaproteobacteria bacterium CG_4_9_14_3_um_filter_51_14]